MTLETNPPNPQAALTRSKIGLAILRLKKNEEKRLKSGHQWIYSNEVDVKATPLKQFTSGEQVLVEDSRGKPLGNAYINPNSLICARLFSRDAAIVLDKSLVVHRLNIALSIRDRIYSDQCYRLVYGDSDLLPGLVVDRYGKWIAIQINTAGMAAVKDDIIAAIDQVLKPEAILLSYDSTMAKLEGLEELAPEVVKGEMPEWVSLRENGIDFEAPILKGQKTGWYYDHRDNRARLKHYADGKRVLDVFSYVGGWGVQAACFGASDVMCVDSSEYALDGVERNAKLNKVASRVSTLQGDAFKALTELKAAEERFDVVIIDPPAFIKRKKDAKKGIEGYRRINELGMRLLNRDGILVSASCSMHLGKDELQNQIRGAGRHLDRFVQLLERGGQGADHPVHPSIPETDYLKAIYCRVLAGI